MAIKLSLNKTERILFCSSKWWGDPDMPADMAYPMMEVNDEGESYDYPLTFICQINCEDIAAFDSAGLLPHEGMLYFFAAIDDYIGYKSPLDNPIGEWPKGRMVVKYAKEINFETFQTCMLLGDGDEQLTEPELEIVFSAATEGDCNGIMMLPPCDTPDLSILLKIMSDQIGGIDFSGGSLDIIIKDSDLRFGNWKKAKAVLKNY